MSKICVLGLGYIGLPTASILATHGHQVVGVDVNQALIRRLRNGEVHIQEPGLNTLVQAGLNSGKLKVAEQPEAADAFIIAVPTPISPDKRADLGYVESAARAILPYLQAGNTVILESTVPPGTTAGMFASLLAESGLDPWTELKVAHSPERVLPGRILEELVSNDRVTGGLTPAGAQSARDLYASFVQGEIFMSDATTAEMVKLMENTYRDVNIALANEFALIAESIGVNVWEAIATANRHPRVNVLRPGPGVGGHCIAVDPWFMVQCAPGPSQLIASARRLNDRMPEHVVEIVRTALAKVKGNKVAVLGLSYKGDVDDMRESPAVTVVRWLLASGCEVLAYDPLISPEVAADPHHGGLKVAVGTVDEAVMDADCVLLLTDHSPFKQLDPSAVGNMMRHRILVDARNGLPHAKWEEAGFTVHVLGRGVQPGPQSDTAVTNGFHKSAEAVPA